MLLQLFLSFNNIKSINMSSSLYMFDNIGRIGNDANDQSQKNLFNMRYTNYMLPDYYNSQSNNDTVYFATSQPNININGIAFGKGINSSVVDNESFLFLKSEEEHSLEKLQLNQRPFASVPYLGRGSCDPLIESQLQQGEIVKHQKSVSTIMDKSFQNYTMYPLDQQMEEYAMNPSFKVEESALDGWVRGGANTRNYGTSKK